MKSVFVSDCEGPISKNDNAFEATDHFIPEGKHLFALISKYDDVLADIVKKPGYNAGDTLKLILPFFKAYHVTDELLKRFSAENLLLIPGSKDTTKHIMSIMDAFIVSTSYEHYIRALCETLGFPLYRTYCTHLNLEKYTITENEIFQIRSLAKAIARKPLIAIPSQAKSFLDLSEEDQKTVMWLDEVFWNKIGMMTVGKVLADVKPIGGRQKAEAVKEATQNIKAQLSDTMYVGDSITDVEAFKLVKENGGLTVSFNGNEYAVRNAEIAILSGNNTVTAVIADLFCKLGKRGTLQILENWNSKNLKKAPASKGVIERLFMLYPTDLPKVQIVTTENMELLIRESSQFRKKIRGEAVGGLG